MTDRWDERELFEAWAVTHKRLEMYIKTAVFINGEYQNLLVQGMWLAWQSGAARASAAPLSPEAWRVAEDVVIREIDSSTGPTGGWLDSPRGVTASIVEALRTEMVASQPQPSAGQPIKKSWARSCTEHKDGYHNNCDACFSDMGVEIMTLRVAEPSAGQTEGK